MGLTLGLRAGFVHGQRMDWEWSLYVQLSHRLRMGLAGHMGQRDKRNHAWDMAGFVLQYRLIVHFTLISIVHGLAASKKGKKLWSK